MSFDSQTTGYIRSQESISGNTVGFKRIHLYKEQTLGIGSYGKVCKAKCDDLTCAAKVMHETLFDPSTSLLVGPEKEHRLPVKRFERECQFLSSLRHPNIIQYLSVYIDPDTRLPALLMELMDGNLTHYLESSSPTQPIPYHIVVNLCHDVTLALSFLHSNSITHRDLSSNNVLLIGCLRAKVTDFGMARFGDMSVANMSHLTYTMCPGTDVYMPPEAVKEEPVYSEKIDCFSFGVIVVQMLTREFPKPSNRRKEVEINHPGLPSGTVEIKVSEIERRQNHISKIDPNHSLLLIALDCLRDKETERPKSRKLCERVATLKESTDYNDSVERQSRGAAPEREILARDNESESDTGLIRLRNAAEVEGLHRVIHLQNTQLEEKEQSILSRDQELVIVKEENKLLKQECRELEQRVAQCLEEISSNQREFHRLDAFIYGKDETIKEREIQIKDQMETSEHVIAQFEERIQELERQLALARLGHRRQERREEQPVTETQTARETTVVQNTSSGVKLQWRAGQKAPYRMSSYYGVAVDGNSTYFKPGGREVYACKDGKVWSQLPNCPIFNCPLVIVNKLLTLVGGSQQDVYSNKLLSLTGGETTAPEKSWTQYFPPMPTKRSNTTAICVGESLIVAGGEGKGVPVMSTVEVMNTWTQQWSMAANLPEPMWDASATVCSDRVYVLGGWNKNRSAFMCSLSDLLHSCKAVKTSTLSRRKNKHSSSSKDEAGVWKKIATLPVTWFACVSVNNQLFLIGGLSLDNEPVAEVHIYNSPANSWEVVGRMSITRRQCFAFVLPSNEIMVIGGVTDDGDSTDSVEIATCV